MASASFRSVAEMFLHRIASTPDSEAFTYPVDQQWRTMTWEEAGARVRAIGSGLLALGLGAEQRCGILSTTRVEWILADMGILTAGGATTTVYASNTADECAFILADSACRVVFTENAEQTARLRSVADRLPGVGLLVQIEPGGEAIHDLEAQALDGASLRVATLQALEDLGRSWDQDHPGAWEANARAVGPERIATLMYTSGTTGRPKGVILTHDCWVFEGEAMDALGIMSPADRQYLFLPLAHAFAKVLEIASIRIGIHTIVDGRRETLVENLAVTRPTFMAAVPRIFEKVHNRIVHQAHQGGRVRTRLFRWAMATGAEMSRIRQAHQRPSRALLLRYALADLLVFSRLRARFGGRLRFFISGGAPLSREIAEFFHAAGVLVLEGYGLTESGAASFVNRPERFRFGTVGPALPGVEVRLDEGDGEILLRSRGVMRGYHQLPEDSAAALAPGGWLRTGDIGQVDADGFLRITDRKKDLIKTSAGKYVAPQLLENRLVAMSPWISQVVVVGDSRNFISALISVDEEQARSWAQAHGQARSDHAALTRHPEVQAQVQAVVDQLNQGLAGFEQIKQFALLPRDLSVEEGELTPTLKVKRALVEQRYKSVIDGFYAASLEQL